MEITITSDRKPGRVFDTLQVRNGKILAVAIYEIGNQVDKDRAFGKCLEAISAALNAALPPSNEV